MAQISGFILHITYQSDPFHSLDLPKKEKKWKENKGFFSLFRRRKKKHEMVYCQPVRKMMFTLFFIDQILRMTCIYISLLAGRSKCSCFSRTQETSGSPYEFGEHFIFQHLAYRKAQEEASPPATNCCFSECQQLQHLQFRRSTG